MWEHYEHGADIGVRGFGATKAEAFEQAALAMTAVVADPAAIDAALARGAEDARVVVRKTLETVRTSVGIR